MNEKDSPFISIIILNWNAGEILLECVKSVMNSKFTNFEIILVDNNSHDNSHKKCKQIFQNIRLIENDENLGYCEGNNVGIRNALGKFIVILNPDTKVNPEWLDEFLNDYKKFGDCLYQPKFLSIDNNSVLGSTGNFIHLFGLGYARGLYENDEGQFEASQVINYASGTCLFAPRHLIEKIGLFDSFIFAYHDDLDLGWRAAQIGITSRYVPKSIVYHHLSGYSFQWSKLKFFYMERNRKYCLLTHYSRSTFYKILPFLLIIEIPIFFFYVKKRMTISFFKIIFDLLKNRKHINKRYKEIQKFRKINDHELIKNFQNEIHVPKNISSQNTNKLFNLILNLFSIISRKMI